MPLSLDDKMTIKNSEFNSSPSSTITLATELNVAQSDCSLIMYKSL